MREQLYLRLEADNISTWLTSDPGSSVRQGSLDEAATAVGGRQVIVLVPATEVTLSLVTVPTRSRTRITAAVPYLLEEQLAADVEEMHFACGERDPQGRVAVAAVARTRLSHWLRQLNEAGIEPDVLIPENLALPWQEGEWTLLIEKQRTLIRCTRQTGFGIETDNLAFILPHALTEGPKPHSLKIINLAKLPLPKVDLPCLVEEGDVVPVVSFAQHYQSADAINLLQGSYDRHAHLSQLWRPWRTAVALLIAWVAVQFGSEILRYHQLSVEQKQLRNTINDIYLKTFPDAKRVVDARVQMEQRLRALRTSRMDVGFMNLMAAIGTLTAGTEHAQVEHLIYRDGEVNLVLNIADLHQLEALKQRLSEQGLLNIDILSATTRNERVEAELHIKRATT